MVNKINTVVVILVIALAYLVFIGNPLAGKDTPLKTFTESDDLTVCQSTTTPDLDINVYDLDNKDTALTESTNLYRKVGDVTWTSFTAGSLIENLNVDEQYEVVMGISTSDFTDNAYGQYFVTDSIPCRELIQMDIGMYNDEVESSLTATFYNRNHDASAETFTAGQVKNVYLHFEAGSNEVFGNPFIAESGLPDNGKHSTDYPNVVCLNLNKTGWDKPEQVIFDGKTLDSIGTPQRHTLSSTATTYCYEFPIITDVGQEVQVRLDADDANAPSVDDTAYLYAGNFYINDNGELAWGIEDEEGNAVGTDAADQLTMDFT